MRHGSCEICKANEAKYKCPQCYVCYCSLACFKNRQLHSHGSAKSADCDSDTLSQTSHDVQNNSGTVPINSAPLGEDSQANFVSSAGTGQSELFERVAQDARVKALLKYKSLQFHLLTLVSILSSPELTNEPNYEGRKEIANMKLCNLRIGGSEENSLVEEFVEVVLDIAC